MEKVMIFSQSIYNDGSSNLKSLADSANKYLESEAEAIKKIELCSYKDCDGLPYFALTVLYEMKTVHAES